MANDRIQCASWCIEGDGHPDTVYRADQWCQGQERSVILGLEEHAPALPLKKIILGESPNISVYARRDWHSLPTLVLNVFRDHDNPDLSVDVDMRLTPDEAVELARNLIAVVEEIAGGA